MKIDIICPLYNAEEYIDKLHNSIIMQKGVIIDKIRYVLTESSDNTEKYLIDNNLYYSITIFTKSFQVYKTFLL